MLDAVVRVANEIRENKYPAAEVVLLAGSIVRGEGTQFSDLDLVIVFANLPNAYRESFYFRDFPVEDFVHDPETINFFITERERPSGVCVMAQMVSEGIELPRPIPLSQRLKHLAASVIEAGPPELGEADLRRMRYNITNLIDDVRQPRSRDELIATGTLLYDALAGCYFRANGLWSAKDKSVPRRLKATDPQLCARFCGAFEELLAEGRVGGVIALAEEILEPVGGFLFEGYKLDAAAGERKPLA